MYPGPRIRGWRAGFLRFGKVSGRGLLGSEVFPGSAKCAPRVSCTGVCEQIAPPEKDARWNISFQGPKSGAIKSKKHMSIQDLELDPNPDSDF